MCEIRTKTIRISILDQWVANLCLEEHSRGKHAAEDSYSLVTGDGSIELTAEQYRQVDQAFSAFTFWREIVGQDTDDCWIELQEDYEPDEHGAPDSLYFGTD